MEVCVQSIKAVLKKIIFRTDESKGARVTSLPSPILVIAFSCIFVYNKNCENQRSDKNTKTNVHENL